jgi:hypothetical protein
MTRVFISWSGKHSRLIATVLRDNLRLIVDGIQPWMSDVDIDAGQRGLPEIEKELGNAAFGIIVVTPENEGSQWINFEAGALSKAVGEREQRVAPILVGYERESDLSGPIAQMQCNLLGEVGLRKVVKSIATATGADEALTLERFDLAWSRLEKALGDVEAPAAPTARKPARPQADVLDEILVTVRALRADAESSRREAAPSSGWRGHRLPRRMGDIDLEPTVLRVVAARVGVGIADARIERASSGRAVMVVTVPRGTTPNAVRSLSKALSDALDGDIDIRIESERLGESAHGDLPFLDVDRDLQETDSVAAVARYSEQATIAQQDEQDAVAASEADRILGRPAERS